VTGSNTGIGKELAQILYSKNATVYIAARSKEKAQEAISSIRTKTPNSTGQLIFLHLDLADLSTIRASAQDFLARETKLHVLFNNAGVMKPPQGSKTAQNYELQLGVNNIGTFLFTKLLTPILLATAKIEPPNTVRVVWVSSSAAEAPFCPTGGVPMDNLDYHNDKTPVVKYAISKAGNYYHATEFAKHYAAEGIISVPLNPGNLNSDLWRHYGPVVNMILKWLLLHPPIYGAYTELFAGLSPAVSIEKTGDWSEFFSP
jgi:retinol dehydrogenase-12